MIKIRKGQRFGYWKVLDSTRYVDHNKNYYLKCKDVRNKIERLVRLDYLRAGKTKGSKEAYKSKGNLGWSTRYKHKELSKYIYKWFDRYRVCIHRNDKFKTLKYFKNLEDAKAFVKEILAKS